MSSLCSIIAGITFSPTELPLMYSERAEQWSSWSRHCATKRKVPGSTAAQWPIPVAARSKAWVCGQSLAGIASSNPARGMEVCVMRCKGQKKQAMTIKKEVSTEKVQRENTRRNLEKKKNPLGSLVISKQPNPCVRFQ